MVTFGRRASGKRGKGQGETDVRARGKQPKGFFLSGWFVVVVVLMRQ